MPLEAHLDHASAENRLCTVLLTLFAASALLLACIDLVAGFLLEGLRVTATGGLAGLILSLSGDRLIANMLYGVKALDAETYGAVLQLMLLVAATASLIPAWHSAQAEPTQALRQQ